MLAVAAAPGTRTTKAPWPRPAKALALARRSTSSATGRADFFSVFTVTFEEGCGRVFHLDA